MIVFFRKSHPKLSQILAGVSINGEFHIIWQDGVVWSFTGYTAEIYLKDFRNTPDVFTEVEL